MGHVSENQMMLSFRSDSPHGCVFVRVQRTGRIDRRDSIQHMQLLCWIASMWTRPCNSEFVSPRWISMCPAKPHSYMSSHASIFVQRSLRNTHAERAMFKWLELLQTCSAIMSTHTRATSHHKTINSSRSPASIFFLFVPGPSMTPSCERPGSEVIFPCEQGLASRASSPLVLMTDIIQHQRAPLSGDDTSANSTELHDDLTHLTNLDQIETNQISTGPYRRFTINEPSLAFPAMISVQ